VFKKLVTLITFLALAACSSQATDQAPVQPTATTSVQGATTTPTQVEPAQPEQPLPTPTQGTQAEQPTQTKAYPGLGGGEIPVEPQPYPGIEQPTNPGVTYVPPAASDYSPQAGDDQLIRGQIFLRLDDSELRSMESYPVQVVAVLRGDLPNPCHTLRVVVTPPDSQNTVQIEVYSLIETGKMCTAVIEPFEAPISLGSFAGGSFTVIVNGEDLGKFDA